MTTLALERFLPYRLNRLASAVSLQFRAVYGPHHDLTVPEWRVLATLGQFGTMTAKAIGAHSAMHKTKVSRAVRTLEERRWLARRENAADRREESLALTGAGQRVYGEIVPRALAFEGEILAALGPDAAMLLQGLDRLEAHLSPRETVRTAGGASRRRPGSLP